jgi:hypothetical protein
MIYNETQKFSAKWIKLVLFTILGGLLLILIFALKNEIHNALLIMSSGILLIVALLFLFSKATLKTSFSETEIKYSFFPFTFKEHTLPLSDIKKVTLKNIDPVGDFGGYGLRLKKNTVAYILSSKIIEILLNNNKTLILSVADTEKIQLFIDTYTKK